MGELQSETAHVAMFRPICSIRCGAAGNHAVTCCRMIIDLQVVCYVRLLFEQFSFHDIVTCIS